MDITSLIICWPMLQSHLQICRQPQHHFLYSSTFQTRKEQRQQPRHKRIARMLQTVSDSGTGGALKTSTETKRG
jgi:hypothetical protein